MAQVLLAAVLCFASTNVDDAALLMLFGAEAVGSKLKRRHVWVGQFLAVGLLTLLGAAGGALAGRLPANFGRYIGLLGFVPILMGVVEIIDNLREGKKRRRQAVRARLQAAPPHGAARQKGSLGTGQVFGVLFSAGADNIGIYIPLFARLDGAGALLTCGVFALLAAVWCGVSLRLSAYPKVAAAVQKYEKVLVPVVFLLLGAYILWDSGVFAAAPL